ncbi:MAG: hypothetical protein ISP90_15770 [Nevskia sp.]|nr:hypothetical protein [Nevskia sp.]
MNDRPTPPPPARPAEDPGLEQLRALYRELPAPAPSDALRKRLQALTQAPAQEQAPAVPPRSAADSAAVPRVGVRRRRWRIPAALAASIAASITVGLLVYLQNPPRPTPSLARSDTDAGPSMQSKGESDAASRAEAPRPAAAPAAQAAGNEPAAPALPALPPAKTAGSLQSLAASPAPPAAADHPSGNASDQGQAEAKSKHAPPPSEPNLAKSAESAPAEPAAQAADAGASAPAAVAGFPDTADGCFAEIRRREAIGDHAGAGALFEQFRKRYPDDTRARQFPAGPP